MAANNDGMWNEVDEFMSHDAWRHSWKTWWFLTSLGLVSIAGGAALARYINHRGLRRERERLKHQRDIERDRARIARDIHDQLGSGLTRINLLSELLLAESPELRAERAGEVSSVACELMRAMDEIVWAVNPKNDTLDSLISHLCDFAEDYLRTAGIRLRLAVPSRLPAWPLTSEVRHNLFLAVKEALHNIVKHAAASEVSLGLKLEARAAYLVIQDNGRGFRLDPDRWSPLKLAHGSTGDGLENLQKRANVMGGECLITSEPGKGTRVEFFIPKPETSRRLRMDRKI